MRYSWQRANGSGGVPAARSSHSVVAVKDSIYVFGGEHEPRTPLPNDVFRYDTMCSQWCKVRTSGKAPCGRVGHAAVAIGDNMYVFGGRTGKDFGDSSLNDLHVLDITSGTWRKLEATGDVPQARSFHVAAAADGCMYVFGGCGAGGRLNELHRYDPAANAWTQLPSSDTVPARGGAGFVASGSTLYVIGGCNGNELADMHAFNTEAGAWRQLDLSSAEQKLPARSVAGVAAVTLGNRADHSGEATRLLVFGGEVEPTDLGHEAAGSYSNDLWEFDTTAPEAGWRKLEGVDGEAPGPRGWFQAAAIDGHGLVVHGGNAPDNSRLGDMFFLYP